MSVSTEPKQQAQISLVERKLFIKLMRRLPKKHKLRSVINAKTGEFAGDLYAAPTLLRLLRASSEHSWRERTAALIALRYLPIAPEDSAEAASVIGKIMLGRDTNIGERVLRRGLWIFLRWLMLWLPAPVFWLVYSVLPDDSFAQQLIACIGLVYAAVAWLCAIAMPIASPMYDSVRASDVCAEAAQTLAVLQLPESVGALARASRSVSLGYDFVRNALMRLLPTLTEEHYGRIGADATPELCALLRECLPDRPYQEKILAALGKVGDGRAVAPLEKFAARHASRPIGQQAEAILPILRARREQENAASMLLRGTSAPPVEAGELLRAVSQSAPTPPQTLLRPAPGLPEPPPADAA